METIIYHFPFGLLLLCILSASIAISATNITTDQFALLSLRAQITTTDPHHILAKNWSSGSSICEWIGVTCGSRHRRVIGLNISNMGLTGIIPPQLGNLSFLVSLDVSTNNFHGEVPHEFAGLHRLRVLNLDVNNLEGYFPPWIDSFHELQYLTLRNNSFTGPILPSISNMSKLVTLRLSNNTLQGNIPKELFNISSLEIIDLKGNSLSGSIPDSVCDRLGSLIELDLSFNQLNGHIPSSLGECSQLQMLSLSGNHFISGYIPKELGNLKMLHSLDLAGNRLEGAIPKGIGNATMLKSLNFDYNNITGATPKEIGNATLLRYLNFGHNNITGAIPREISNLHNLEFLSFEMNKLTGSIPVEIFNLSMMRIFGFGMNQLSGNLPSTMCHMLPNLEQLYLEINNFTGSIPNSIPNSSRLNLIELSHNFFTGFIPHSLGELRFLEVLNLCSNNLVSDSSSPELGFITLMTNSERLTMLEMCENPFNATLPNSAWNHSSPLQYLYVYSSGIKGSIPDGIGNLSSLVTLSMKNNHLTGSFPDRMQDLQKLQGVDLLRNKLSEITLNSFCVFRYLVGIHLDENQISGSIPECLGNVTSLRDLSLGFNRLNSTIPATLWQLKDLVELNLSSNLLSGSLPPEVSSLKIATAIDLSMNRFSGDIPTTIGKMQNLNYLSLSHNRLHGSIPESIGTMLSLQSLDISHNLLSGSIPRSMETLEYLTYLNVSFNNLTGEIPSGGPFRNFTSDAFISNAALCGAQRFHVPPCPSIPSHRSKTKKVHRTMFILLGVIIAMGAISFGFVYLRCRRKDKLSSGEDLSLVARPERLSYFKLLQATNGYSESNLLGTGSFGSVYKGTLDDGRVVAIKVFNLELEGAFKSFDAECEVLRNLRHRNLTKVIGSCSNPDFKALVLEFMPNGSLEKWLCSHNDCLDIMQRLDILIDVATALQYLHCEYSTPVAHCDLKPGNVLLDETMVAHVSDFGIAKLLGQDNITFTKTLATLGYLAPEYGLEGLVSTKCDVYSFGIMMMEVFTRTNPNDERFGEKISLKSWVNDCVPNGITHILDANLLRANDGEYFIEKLDCISSMMKVALNCTMESPRERSNSQDVLVALKKIKLQLLPYKGP
nr:LRR receptor-like serine/threonine-protein kinase EFR [Coffea arabica]